MATSKNILDYLLDQLKSARNVRARKMFGEYALYCDDKVVALVCDDQLFVKMTPAGKEHVGDRFQEGVAYPGAKPSMLITPDYFDDEEWLSQLIRVTANALPAAKPKAAKRGVGRKKPAGAEAIAPTWVDVETLTSLGHGVEFHHNALGSGCGQPLAFIDGFDWLHGRSNTATVMMLSARALSGTGTGVDAKTIRKDVRHAVRVFLSDRARWRHGAVTGTVAAVFNA